MRNFRVLKVNGAYTIKETLNTYQICKILNEYESCDEAIDDLSSLLANKLSEKDLLKKYEKKKF